MTPAELGYAITLFIGVSGALWAVWWRIEGKVKEGKQEASVSALAAKAKADFTAEELAAYKLHVSETYATKAGMNEGLVDVKRAIGDYTDRMERRFDGMNDRLDRVIEANHKPVRRQP